MQENILVLGEKNGRRELESWKQDERGERGTRSSALADILCQDLSEMSYQRKFYKIDTK